MAKLGHRADVARPHLRRRYVLLAAGKEDLGQPLVAAPAQVRQVHVGLDGAGHDFEVADSPELVAAGAEDERLGGPVGVSLGGRQELADRRHQRPHAEQLGRRAADDGRDLAGEDAFAQPSLDLLLAERSRIEVLLQQLVVALGGRLDQLAAVFLDKLLHFVRDRRLTALAIRRGDEGLHVQEVDDAPEVLLGSDRQVERKGPGREVLAHRSHRAVEVGVLLVELVDDDDSRLAGAVTAPRPPRSQRAATNPARPPPRRLRLRAGR